MVDNHKWAGNCVGETHVIDQMGMLDKKELGRSSAKVL